MTSAKKTFGCIFLLVLVPMIFFWEGVVGTKIIAAGDLSGSDLLEMQLPFKYILQDSLSRLELPLWTPYLGNGFPTFAEGQGAYLYPVNLLLSAVPPYLALNYSILFAISWCGIGTFCYAKSFKILSRPICVYVALCFMFSAFFVARVKHLNIIAVAAWLPWSLLIIRSYAMSGFKSSVLIVLPLVWMVQMLAGHQQLAYYSYLMSLWWWLVEINVCVLKLQDKKIAVNLFKQNVVKIVFVALLTVGLSAVQILPSLELMQHSYRSRESQFSIAATTNYPLHPAFLITFFAPYLLGNPANGSYTLPLQKYGVWWENVMYSGFLNGFLLLGGVVYFSVKAYRKRLLVKQLSPDTLLNYIKNVKIEYLYLFFFFISFIFFLSLAMGGNSIVYLLAYYLVPGISFFRFPNRFNLFVILSVCMISGFMLEFLYRWFATRFKKVHVIIISVFVFVLSDLFFFTRSYVGFYSVANYLRTPEFVNRVPPAPKNYRVYQTTHYTPNPYSGLGWKKGEKEINSLQEAMPGNLPLVYGYASFTDRDWAEGGLDIRDLSMIEEYILDKQFDLSHLNNVGASRLLGLWNVGYIFTFANLDSSYYRLINSMDLGSNYFTEQLRFYEVKSRAPRAFVVSELEVADSKKEVLSNLASLRHGEKFIVSDSTSGLGSQELYAFYEPGNNAQNVIIEQYLPLEVRMKVTTDQRSFLVFSDLMYPGWIAYINGQRTEPFAVNIVQRSLKLVPGSNTIVWRFETQSFRYGMWVSIISAVIYVLIVFRWIRIVYAKK